MITAQEIAETLTNGNISDARRAITTRRTQFEAVVMALDVLEELIVAGSDPLDEIARLRRCVRGG